MENVTNASAFAVTMGVMSTVVSGICGWLLNRVFTEIDRLRQQDEKLAQQVAALGPLMIDRHAFDRHVEREERHMSELAQKIEKLSELLAQLKLLIARNHLEK